MQNLADMLLTCPHEQVHSSAGFLVPHSWQNLPVFCVPQLGQVQLPAGAAGAGIGVPHSWQNLPVFCVPQLGQVQPLAACWPGVVTW